MATTTTTDIRAVLASLPTMNLDQAEQYLRADAPDAKGVGRQTLRKMALHDRDFTVVRKGNRLHLRTDELKAFDEWGIDGLRKFRLKAGRAK